MNAVAGHTYAQILGGVVNWIFTSTQLPEWNADTFIVADITGISPVPALGWTATETNGAWAFTVPVAPTPTAAQMAHAAFAAGVQITSTGTPALNGAYSLNDSSLCRITSEQVYIATTGKFTNGQTTRSWLDASGAPHPFPSTAEFTAFAEAVAQYEDALLAAQAVVQAGGAWVAPAQPARLA